MSIFNYDNFLLLWIAIMGVISSGTHIEVKENVLGNEVERYNLVFALIVFAPIFLLASVGEVRYDVWQYLVNFDNASDNIHYIFDNWSNFQDGQGFYAIEALIKQIFGNNRDAFRIIVALMQSIPVVFVLRKYSENYIFSIFLFITYGFYHACMMNALRQFIAVSLVFAALPLLLKRKYVPLFVIVLIAITIHKSAIIMIPFLLVSNLSFFSKKTWFLVISISIVVYIYVDRYAQFAEEIISVDDGSNPLRILFSAIPIILIFIRKEKIIDNNNKLINICMNMSLITVLLFFVATFTSGVYVGRLPFYTNMYNMILLPYLVKTLFNSNEQKIITLLLLLVFIVYFEVGFIL